MIYIVCDVIMLVRHVVQEETGLSRRWAFALFVGEKVLLNGEVCENFKTACQTGDIVRYDNGRGREEVTVSWDGDVLAGSVILFHKPVWCVVARQDERSSTIYDILPSELHQHFRYVGRLDRNSSWLLLLTRDGQLIHQLTHPQFHISKVYQVTINRPLEEKDLSRLLSGEVVGMFDPEDDRTDTLWFQSCEWVDSTTLTITLSQGKKRHIRRLLRHVGYRVRTLTRTSVWPLVLDGIEEWAYRFATDRELVLLDQTIADATQKT